MPEARTNLRVLIVEDSSDDAALILRELRKSGYELVSERVDTASAMRAALSDKSWDIILSDYMIPGFGGMDALLIAKKSGLDLPFILVSGKVGEETAVEAMKAGATDFVMKDRLGRLGSVVKRELADATARKQAEKAVSESENKFRQMGASAQDAIIVVNQEGSITDWNAAAQRTFGYAAEEVIGRDLHVLIAPARRHEEISKGLQQFRTSGTGPVVNKTLETVALRRGGTEFPVELSISSAMLGGQWHAIGIVRDITERKQAELALRHVNRTLRALSDCNQALIKASDETQLLSEICRVIVEVGGYRLAYVGSAEDDANKSVRTLAQFGYDEGYLAAARISWADTELGRGPTGTAIRTGVVQVNQNFQSEAALMPWREAALARGYQSSIALPLKNSAGILGVLTVYAAEPNAFNEVEIKLLQELADDLAFGIQTLRTRHAQERSAERLQRSMEATVQAVASTVEMRDPYTAGHQRRVAELATAIARDMGLAQDHVRSVYLAGVVHDLGKIHVPAEILSKPGKLSVLEFELIKTHPQTAYDILKGVDFPWPIAQIVFQHHERIDGSGYPRGLKGEEILLEARILMVADVVEAMASHRPYRPALGNELALQEISANAGKYYDADVVRSCVGLFHEKGFVFKT